MLKVAHAHGGGRPLVPTLLCRLSISSTPRKAFLQPMTPGSIQYASSLPPLHLEQVELCIQFRSDLAVKAECCAYRAGDRIFGGAALQEAVLVTRAVHDRTAARRRLTREQTLRQAQDGSTVAHTVLHRQPHTVLLHRSLSAAPNLGAISMRGSPPVKK